MTFKGYDMGVEYPIMAHLNVEGKRVADLHNFYSRLWNLNKQAQEEIRKKAIQERCPACSRIPMVVQVQNQQERTNNTKTGSI